eukprot:359021-Chlamydomonas_euryale.AAC.3
MQTYWHLTSEVRAAPEALQIQTRTWKASERAQPRAQAHTHLAIKGDGELADGPCDIRPIELRHASNEVAKRGAQLQVCDDGHQHGRRDTPGRAALEGKIGVGWEGRRVWDDGCGAGRDDGCGTTGVWGGLDESAQQGAPSRWLGRLKGNSRWLGRLEGNSREATEIGEKQRGGEGGWRITAGAERGGEAELQVGHDGHQRGSRENVGTREEAGIRWAPERKQGKGGHQRGNREKVGTREEAGIREGGNKKERGRGKERR